MIMPPGRNDPCPCGSGRKYKQCCLARAEARDANGADGAQRDRGSPRALREQVRAAAASESTWAADAIPLMIGVEQGDAPRPVGMLVTAGELIVQSEIRGRLRGEPADVAAALDRAVVAAARDVGVFPERLRVRHQEVATALAPLLAPRQIAVEAAAVPELEEAARGLMEHVAGHATWPPVCRAETWSAWDLSLPLVARLFAAAAQFYRLAPWRDVANLQAPRAVLPSGRAWTCCVLGNGGEEFGLALYSDASDLFDVLAHNAPHEAFAGVRGRVVSVTFDSMSHAGPAAVREARLHRWEVAGPAAYPTLITVNTPGGGASRADVEDIVALFHALPPFVQRHRRALQREDTTNAPFLIEWVEPESGITFRYAGEATLHEEREPEDDPFAAESEFHAELRAAVRNAVAEVGEDADESALLAALERALQQKTTAYDQRPQPDLGALAPEQVTRLLRSDWMDPHGAVQLRTDLTPDEVAHSSIVANARTLLELAIERGELGATQAGNLKLEVVGVLLDRMRFDDEYGAELRAHGRRITEQDVGPVHRVRVVCGLAGLLRRRSQRFEPTRLARSLVQPDRAGELFALLFRTWFRKFNLAYGTRVEWPELQHQVAFTLYRLPSVASDWCTAADLVDDVVLPYVLEQFDRRNARFPELGAVDLAICVLEPLAGFGLLARRRKPPSRSWLDDEFRATPLARSAIRFEL
jgi:hypothetical protein